MIALETVLRRHDDIRYRTIDREAVVVRQRAAEVLVLSDVASRILDLADGAAPVGAWVEALAAEYAVPKAELTKDVLEFTAELAREGLLEVVLEKTP